MSHLNNPFFLGPLTLLWAKAEVERCLDLIKAPQLMIGVLGRPSGLDSVPWTSTVLEDILHVLPQLGMAEASQTEASCGSFSGV